jgi:hypothetical protein
VNTLFMATVGAVALALGLAFGLGGRETAAQIVRNWYERGQEAAPKMVRAAEAAQDRTDQDGGFSRTSADEGPMDGRPRVTQSSPRPISPQIQSR